MVCIKLQQFPSLAWDLQTFFYKEKKWSSIYMGAQNCKFYFRTLKSISEGTRPIFVQNEETNLIFPPDPLHLSAVS